MVLTSLPFTSPLLPGSRLCVTCTGVVSAASPTSSCGFCVGGAGNEGGAPNGGTLAYPPCVVVVVSLFLLLRVLILRMVNMASSSLLCFAPSRVSVAPCWDSCGGDVVVLPLQAATKFRTPCIGEAERFFNEPKRDPERRSSVDARVEVGGVLGPRGCVWRSGDSRC
jgi:hypothetical protein